MCVRLTEIHTRNFMPIDHVLQILYQKHISSLDSATEILIFELEAENGDKVWLEPSATTVTFETNEVRYKIPGTLLQPFVKLELSTSRNDRKIHTTKIRGARETGDLVYAALQLESRISVLPIFSTSSFDQTREFIVVGNETPITIAFITNKSPEMLLIWDTTNLLFVAKEKHDNPEFKQLLRRFTPHFNKEQNELLLNSFYSWPQVRFSAAVDGKTDKNSFWKKNPDVAFFVLQNIQVGDILMFGQDYVPNEIDLNVQPVVQLSSAAALRDVISIKRFI